jgi:hypothetical protein
MEASFYNSIDNFTFFLIFSTKCFLLALPLITGLPTGFLDVSLIKKSRVSNHNNLDEASIHIKGKA